MISSVSLNEFSKEQLELALYIFEVEIDSLAHKLMIVSSFEDSVMKDEFSKEYNTKIDDCLLWKVQIMNALDDIKVQTN